MAVLMQSPFYQQIVADLRREHILEALDLRLGPVPQEVADRVRSVVEADRLRALFRCALTAQSLEEFVRELGAR